MGQKRVQAPCGGRNLISTLLIYLMFFHHILAVLDGYLSEECRRSFATSVLFCVKYSKFISKGCSKRIVRAALALWVNPDNRSELPRGNLFRRNGRGAKISSGTDRACTGRPARHRYNEPEGR